MTRQVVPGKADTGKRGERSRRRPALTKGLLVAPLVALAAASTVGAGPEPSPAGASRPAVTVERRGPKVGPGMFAQDRWHLNQAFALALERVQSNGTCSAMFDSLKADAVSALIGTVYTRAQTASDMALCRAGAIAVTEVDGYGTRICPSVLRLSRERLATILIHEALHSAGMSEAPFDPQAPTSREITRMVKVACAL